MARAGRCVWMAGVMLLALAGAARAADVPAHDVAGSHDASLLPRILDARIVSYDQSDDEEATLPNGPFRNFDFTGTLKLEGRVTRIAYVFPQKLSTLAIMRRYLDMLGGAGFEIRFRCEGSDGCGGFNFGEALTQPMAETHAGDEGNLIIDFLHPVGGDIRYVLATLDRPEGRVTLALAVARHVDREPGLFIEMVEQPSASAASPVDDAGRIEAALRAQGRIALYDIHFVSDRPTLRPDSRPALAQIAAMLLADPAMKLIIVGHSDASVPREAGLLLSTAQAEAVLQALGDRWKVPPAQLAATGVGPVSPIASNADEAGRARNRRIELVLQ